MINFIKIDFETTDSLKSWDVFKVLNDSHRTTEYMGRISYNRNCDLSYFPGGYEPYRLHTEDMVTIAKYMEKIKEELGLMSEKFI